MAGYDPQRMRNRPAPTTDRPSPVDALLDAKPLLDIDIEPSGDAIVHTSRSDIEMTPSGDDVIVTTRDARVEVRADADEVIVETAGEQIHIDTSIHPNTAVVRASDANRSKLMIGVAVGAVAVLLLLLMGRRKR